MVLASSVLLAAGNLQTLSMMACSNDSLPMILKSLPAFTRQLGADLEQALAERFNFTSQSIVWNFAARFLGVDGQRPIVSAS
jgi:hypothetical protein